MLHFVGQNNLRYLALESQTLSLLCAKCGSSTCMGPRSHMGFKEQSLLYVRYNPTIISSEYCIVLLSSRFITERKKL
jgi:hypothetical protein